VPEQRIGVALQSPHHRADAPLLNQPHPAALAPTARQPSQARRRRPLAFRASSARRSASAMCCTAGAAGSRSPLRAPGTAHRLASARLRSRSRRSG
jgi:hypothetical protein